MISNKYKSNINPFSATVSHFKHFNHYWGYFILWLTGALLQYKMIFELRGCSLNVTKICNKSAICLIIKPMFMPQTLTMHKVSFSHHNQMWYKNEKH